MLNKTKILLLVIILIIVLLNINISVKDKDQLIKNKLTELNNIHKKINYFNYNNIDRYIKYKTNNKKLPIEKIIINVNIGLDNPFYTNIKETTYKNKNYILVNKYNYLNENYIPKNLEYIDKNYSTGNLMLVKNAKVAFEEMAKDAKKENLTIIALSAYRNYTYQKNLYEKYISIDKKEKVDTYSARPGHSEHQTGLAVDIYNKIIDYNNFDITKEFIWLHKNAHKYGFILRYPQDKIKETGYQYEPWHYRYVGTKIASYINKNKISYEEYYVKYIENKKD